MKAELKPLPPEEAIAAFRRKGYKLSFAWQDVWQAEHAKAFTVAKAMRQDILETIRAEVDRAIAEGTTLADFRKRLTPVLRAKGWWGRKTMVDPLTGERRMVQLGSPRRLRVIFDTNLRMSYATGRWEQIQRVKERRPYLRYVAILDGRTRPEHRAWHGTVLPVDHEFWNTHAPPNGWRCRCSLQQLSPRDVAAAGGVSPAPPVVTRPYRNPRTGEVQSVPDGIDPGFAYNPGKAALAPATRPGSPPASGPPPSAPPAPAGTPVAIERADREAKETVLERGRATGHEWLSGYDQETGERLDLRTDNDPGTVTFGDAITQAIIDPKRRIVLHHNHPSDRALSQADLNALMHAPGMAEVVAHGHRGSSYRASRGPKALQGRDFRRAYAAAGDAIAGSLREAVQTGQMTNEEANHVYGLLIMRALMMSRIIDGLAQPGAELTAILQRHRQRIETLPARGAAAIAKALSRDQM